MGRQRIRPSERLCPKCRVRMRLVQLEAVQVDLCPNCMGMWFDTGELSRATGLKFRDTARGAAIAHAKRTVHRCPSCAIPLREREIDRGCGIFIDQCPQCSGLFLDRDEFSRTKGYLKSIGAPPRGAVRVERTAAPTEPAELDEDSILLTVFQYITHLPVEINLPQRLLPPVVITLLLLNVAAFVYTWLTDLPGWIDVLGLVPSEVGSGHRLYTFFTSMFMHVGVLHILGNMYFLYITGDNIEDRFGWHRFLGFYVLCGLVAGIAHMLGNLGSNVPAIGASGAVSGVLGAYIVLFPRTRFLFRWLLGWRFMFHVVRFEVPAYAYLGLWIVLQLVYASLDVPGVAWWAHIGGFACGAGIAGYVRLRERVPDTTTTRRAQR